MKSIFVSNPAFQNKVTHEARERGVLNWFIMMCLVLQLLTTTRQYCAIRYSSTRLRDRKVAP